MSTAGFQDERKTIEDYFKAQFTAYLIAFDNVPFPPDDSSGNIATYVTCSIIHGGGPELLTIGENPVKRYVGVVQNNVVCDSGIGTDFPLQIADQIAAIWELKALNTQSHGQILFDAPNISNLGVSGGQQTFAVSTAYRRTDYGQFQ